MDGGSGHVHVCTHGQGSQRDMDATSLQVCDLLGMGLVELTMHIHLDVRHAIGEGM